MIRTIVILLVSAVVNFASAGNVVFDNGKLSGAQVGRNMGIPFTMYDDFILTESNHIIGFRWTQHDADALTREYLGTTLSIYESEPKIEALLYSNTIIASRKVTGTIISSEPLIDYEFMGLSLDLGPGKYYLALQDIHSGFSGWVQTTGTDQTIPGRWQSRNPHNLGNFFSNENSVFQVIALVPEPTSLIVGLQAGLLALGIHRRRNRTA